jgi:hypothetical protein
LQLVAARREVDLSDGSEVVVVAAPRARLGLGVWQS